MVDSKDINDLHPAVKRGVEELIRRMKEKGYPIGISSTYRDSEFQNNIYAQGRTKPGKIITNAKGGQSMHNYKLAFDIFKNLKGEAYSDSSFFKKAGEIWMQMGGEWGGSWQKFVDMPHFQFTNGLSLSQLQKGAKVPENTKMAWEQLKGGEELSRVEDLIFIVNGKEHIIPGIFQEGKNYPDLRALASLLDVTVGNVGKVPTLTKN